MSPQLHIIICSTRPGRGGHVVAEWIHKFALNEGTTQAKLVDLADFNLPVYDEPEHPRLKKYQHDHTKAWSASVDSADAFIFVTPEYNYGPPPALVNALNYVYNEWHYKPAAFVSYGGISGALRAVQVEKLTLTTLKVVPIVEGVIIPNFKTHFDASGKFVPNDLHVASATAMLSELVRWSQALKALRK